MKDKQIDRNKIRLHLGSTYQSFLPDILHRSSTSLRWPDRWPRVESTKRVSWDYKWFKCFKENCTASFQVFNKLPSWNSGWQDSLDVWSIVFEMSSLGSNLDLAINCHLGVLHARRGIIVCWKDIYSEDESASTGCWWNLKIPRSWSAGELPPPVPWTNDKFLPNVPSIKRQA